ncbi:MAG: phospholipase D family protein [Idiomarina sp.]|nr:phospholipase D family protein [Idiomarina sp.]
MYWRYFTLLGVVIFTLIACAALPGLSERQASFAFPTDATKGTALGQLIAPLVSEYPQKSGILTLAEAKDAFAARQMLASAAEQSLDVQYYLWRNDKTGRLLMQALYDAAQRGVRVRLLMDDLNTAPIEDKLIALNQHENIQVRLFNPFVVRGPRSLGFVTDFNRANRRMHNKSFTADNQATIIGGRNVGDDYFSGADGVLFADLDALAIGEVVADVSKDFDAFWNSDSSFPMESLTNEKGQYAKQALIEQIFEVHEASALFLKSVQDRELVRQMLQGYGPIIWAKTRMVSDAPAKGLGKAEPDELITHALQEIIGEPKRSIFLVSPYFVPTKAGVRSLESMAEAGVEIHILTNSFAATDVAIVHSGYAKWRKRLLEAGIRLYEMRPNVVTAPENVDWQQLPRFASAATSLHAKTFAVDGERVFIGSFNFDPRSARLNTELGFIIESEELAAQTEQLFAIEVPFSAYELRLAPSGRMYWLQRDPGHLQRHDSEPGSTWWQRASVTFFSWLPIDWLL